MEVMNILINAITQKLLVVGKFNSLALSRYSPTENTLYVQTRPCVTSVGYTHFPLHDNMNASQMSHEC